MITNSGFAGIWAGGKRNNEAFKKAEIIMTDVHDKKTRSFNMSMIKSKDTKPEIIVWKKKFKMDIDTDWFFSYFTYFRSALKLNYYATRLVWGTHK